MERRSKCLHLSLCLILFIGSVCFYHGFFSSSTSSHQFSTMGELPGLNNSNKDNFFAYKNHFNKSVIIVIDSLRYDFVDNSEDVFFPYLSDKLNGKESCLFKVRVQSPTVTLPRIKSLLTGTVPAFLDIVSNFGKSEIGSDNLISQAKANGLKTIFFGDETWISLLPHEFERSEGTTSFFVSDYTEVDVNVTRNMKKELDRDYWNIMILHYLGLDHIGHLEGPRSKLIKPKLLEMDSVISQINEKFLRRNERVLIVICGDHGMKDSGGHGGTSLPEVLVPVALLNYNCEKSSRRTDIGQMDLAPFLSVLLGLPIPADSVGKIHHEMLKGLDSHHALYGLFYNTIRLLQKFTVYYQNEDNVNDISVSFNNGVKYLKQFLTSHSYSDYVISAEYFTLAQEILSNKLISANLSYDVVLMIFGMMLFLQSLSASVFGSCFVSKISLVKLLLLVIIAVLFHFNFCYLSESTSYTCSVGIIGTFSTLIIYFLLISNVFFIKYSSNVSFSFSIVRLFFTVGTLLHAISLTSSSYIEEEHQLWYFLIVTFFLLSMKKDLIGFSLLLFCHRILRCFNQTGDKWASLPDIEDWLMDNNPFFCLVLYTFSLIATFISCKIIISNLSSQRLINLFTVTQFLCIFLYKVISGSLKIINLEPSQFLGVMLARCFWMSTVFKSIFIFYSLKSSKLSCNNWAKRITAFILELLVTIFCLLYKPHNLIIIPALIIYSHITVKLFKNDTYALIYFHNWLGVIFYFYQGNSNSISTIDVAAGYVGLETYNIYITGLYIALNTFSGPILSFLLMVRALAENSKLIDCQAEVYNVHTFTYGFQISVYSFIIIIQKDHIFIWSVFAPKLLYILSFIVLNVGLMLLLFAIVLGSKVVNGSINFNDFLNCNFINKFNAKVKRR